MGEYLVHYGVKGMKWGKRKITQKSTSMDDLLSAASGRSQLEALEKAYEWNRTGSAERSRKIAKGKTIRQDEYFKRVKKYVSHAINRLKAGDVKTAIHHGKTAVDSLLKAFGTRIVKYNREKGTFGTYTKQVDESYTKYADGSTSLQQTPSFPYKRFYQK